MIFYILTEDSSCVSWRQTGRCDPNGPRESHLDKNCGENVPSDASGYCDCANGAKRMTKTCGDQPTYETCNEACNGNP